jgi:hypothetical protein
MTLHELLRAPPRPLDRQAAWACFLANTVMLPGVGSLIAGRRRGIFQMVITLFGTALTLVFAVWFVREYLRTQMIPAPEGLWFLAGVLGAGLFATGWIWAFFTSLSILQESRREPPQS